jgi:hypothetical protein
VMTPYSLARVYHHFGGVYCLHLQKQVNQFWPVTAYVVEVWEIGSHGREVPNQNHFRIRGDIARVSQPRL